MSVATGYSIAFIGVLVSAGAFFKWLAKDHVRIQHKRDYIAMQKSRAEEGKRSVMKDDLLAQTPVEL